MNNLDKVSKETKSIAESIQDSITSNLMTAARSKMINCSDEDLERLIRVVEVSVSEGYQKSLPFFQNSIKKIVG